jgi:hypothetical protein
MGAEISPFGSRPFRRPFPLGQGSGKILRQIGLHHPHFALTESVMPRGVELHVNLALRALRKLQQGEPVAAA